MTKRELDKIMTKNGWRITHGAKHDAYEKAGTGVKIPVPRHGTDIPVGTLNNILNAADIKKK
ncbi:MAG: type II toxin-antitoxin system HicA family toxin [Oscillospiraceae bacterium]|jgi:predicted RNA binding protein YcfA (HicA-like mRNA interferase family)|nr:type II toxin-antitoxin system HicA family toxin [Oscillospiraceae bacterium]